VANAVQAREQLRLADLLAALSVVTDLGHGQPPENAMRSCLLATGLADRMGLGAEDVTNVYYATLLRYIGCTAYAHEEAAIFDGDEISGRAAITKIDTGNPQELLSFGLRGVGRNAPPLRRARLMATTLPRLKGALRELASSNCEVGAGMAKRLGLNTAVQQALLQLYERWDGKGEPHKVAGDALALPLRFSQVASQAVIFAQEGGVAMAISVVRRRAGTALDPAIVAAFQRYGPALLSQSAGADSWKAVVAAEPEPKYWIPLSQLDDVARAFADMVDLKLPFTRGHSTAVATLAEAAARSAGLPEEGIADLRRAALFHDLGRVGIRNGIWEKPGSLTDSDWEQVRLHPYHTERILSRSPALTPLARLAGMHHERQDGSGYYRQLSGSAVPIAARLLAAADVYQALTQERPHRPARTPTEAAEHIRAEAEQGRLDSEAVRHVLGVAGHRQPRPLAQWPLGLSDREVEVLRLIAQGDSYKGVAHRLYISPRTAAHHVQHIYNKIGVSTRAAAAMFAMEHNLLQ